MHLPINMRGCVHNVILFAASLAVLGMPASAQTLYSNGPINGQVDSWTINYGYGVANSFFLSGTFTLAGVEFGGWTEPGDTITGVDWSIVTGTPFTSQTTLFSVTDVAVSDKLLYNNDVGYDVGLDSFSLGDISLGPGTYYLELQNAVVTGGDPGFWDMNNGPSTAYDSAWGLTSNPSGPCGYDFPGGTCSDSFQIYSLNGPTTVPEASTLALLGIGLLAFLPLWRRRRAF